MDFALVDLFGGTTDLFESEADALLAADELLERYRRQATINEWQDPDYMSGIMVMQVSHRVTPIGCGTAVNRNASYARRDYCLRPTKRPPRLGKIVAVKG